MVYKGQYSYSHQTLYQNYLVPKSDYNLMWVYLSTVYKRGLVPVCVY